MRQLQFISKCAAILCLGLLLLSGCRIGKLKIFVSSVNDTPEEEVCVEELSTYLKNRGRGKVLVVSDEEDAEVRIKLSLNQNIAGDYRVEKDHESITLESKLKKNMRWLEYQTIKYLSQEYDVIQARDLPCISVNFDDSRPKNVAFEYRAIYTPTGLSEDLRGLHALDNIEEDWGLWGHNMAKVCGKEKGLDIYARINGHEEKDQLCFSSAALMDKTIDYIIDGWGDGSKTPEKFAIFPNDNTLACQCINCTKAGNTPGNATPAVSLFVEKLAKRFPHHTFFTSGYLTTAKLPSHMLPDNVGVLLSAIDLPRNINADLDDFSQLIKDWQKVCKTVYIWDYINNFDDYYTPEPIIMLTKRRLRIYKTMGVKGVFLNGSGHQYSTNEEMVTCILSKVMLNINTNVDSTMTNYIKAAYPENHKLIVDYLLYLEKKSVKTNVEIPLYGGIEDAFIPDVDDALKFYNDLPEPNEKWTPKEYALMAKLRHDLSYTVLEMGRSDMINFRDNLDLMHKAVRLLGSVPSSEELQILLHRHGGIPQSVNKIDESGNNVSAYLDGCIRWLDRGNWERNLLLGKDVNVIIDGENHPTNKLSDGVDGIGANYHWGWTICPQENTVMRIPAEGIQSGRHLSITFLNLERHRISPPAGVDVYFDGNKVGKLGYIPLEDSETLTFEADLDFATAQHEVELRFSPSYMTTDFAMDEIIISR